MSDKQTISDIKLAANIPTPVGISSGFCIYGNNLFPTGTAVVLLRLLLLLLFVVVVVVVVLFKSVVVLLF